MKKLQSEDNNKTPQLLDKVGTETLLALLTCHTKTEASEQLGIDRKTLYLRMEKYGLREYINRLPEQAMESLKMGSIKAVENYVRKIDHRDASISLEASNQILDRVGLGAKQQSGSPVNVNILNQLQVDKEQYQL